MKFAGLDRAWVLIALNALVRLARFAASSFVDTVVWMNGMAVVCWKRDGVARKSAELTELGKRAF